MGHVVMWKGKIMKEIYIGAMKLYMEWRKMRKARDLSM